MPRFWEFFYAARTIHQLTKPSGRSRQSHPPAHVSARPLPVQTEKTLIDLAAKHAKKWGVVEDTIREGMATEFSPTAIRELRDMARTERWDAMARNVSNQLTNLDLDPNSPVWRILHEMEESAPSVWEHVIEACNTGEPSAWEAALSSTLYCQSLAEKAMMTVGELSQQREAKAAAQSKNNKMLGVMMVVVLTVLFISCAVARMAE